MRRIWPPNRTAPTKRIVLESKLSWIRLTDLDHLRLGHLHCRPAFRPGIDRRACSESPSALLPIFGASRAMNFLIHVLFHLMENTETAVSKEFAYLFWPDA